MTLMLSTVFLVAVAIVGIVVHRQFFSHIASNYINLGLGVIVAGTHARSLGGNIFFGNFYGDDCSTTVILRWDGNQVLQSCSEV